MILSDSRILDALSRGIVVVTPLDPAAVGPNSIDLHLGPHLAAYAPGVLRTDREPRLVRSLIDEEEGSLLVPGEIYLGATLEHVSCGPFVPMLEGTSSASRLGLSVHVTAGVGDVGFAGWWTLEITVVRPVLVFGGEPVAQIVLHEAGGDVVRPYQTRESSSYGAARTDPRPQPSAMWRKQRAPLPRIR